MNMLLYRGLVDKYMGDALGERGWKKMQKWQTKQTKDDVLVARMNKLFYIILRLLFHARFVVGSTSCSSGTVVVFRQIATGRKYQVFYPQDSSEHQLLQEVRSGQVPHKQLADTIET